MSRVIAVTNQKGGVGKTTTAVHLASAAARRGMRTLLVDLDPQGNATLSTLPEQVSPDTVGLADALLERAPQTLADVIVPSVWDNLDVAPTTGDEAMIALRNELTISALAGREHRLATSLATVKDEYDLVLIDCPPALDQLTLNGLTAADYVLIVTEAKLYSVQGIAQLLKNIASVQKWYNQDLKIAGVVVNKLEAATRSAKAAMENLEDLPEGIELLNPPIPKRVVISDALEAATSLPDYGTTEAKAIALIYEKLLTQLVPPKE